MINVHLYHTSPSTVASEFIMLTYIRNFHCQYGLKSDDNALASNTVAKSVWPQFTIGVYASLLHILVVPIDSEGISTAPPPLLHPSQSTSWSHLHHFHPALPHASQAWDCGMNCSLRARHPRSWQGFNVGIAVFWHAMLFNLELNYILPALPNNIISRIA